MKTTGPIFAAGLMVWILGACGEKKHAAETRPKRTDIIVHDDPKKLSEMINLPAPVSFARWSVVSVVPQSRDDIGPSDYNLYVVVALDSAKWPAWERALTPASPQKGCFLMQEVAEKLLPPEMSASCVADSLMRGCRLSGTFYEPDSLASGGFHSGIAVRHGNYLFMTFYTM
jgi:hypothetical protein